MVTAARPTLRRGAGPAAGGAGHPVLRTWPKWHTNDGFWVDADGVRIDVAPLRFADRERKAADVERLTRLIQAAPRLLLALELICENSNHDLLPTERETAEDALRLARGG